MTHIHRVALHHAPPICAARGWLIGLLAAGLLIAACGEQATPEPTDTPEPPAAVAAAPAATSPLPTPTAPQLPTVTEAPATEPAAEPVTETEAAAQPVVTTTVTVNGSTAVFSPLEVDEGADCEIESHLDLVGYPELDQRMGCPVEEARLDAIGINEFGDIPPYDRFMLWFSHETQIYVLFPDGTYQVYPDTWVEGRDPTHPCNPIGGEADSPPLPRRGFGKLWCEHPEIQAIMGTVPREERLCQHSVLQRFEKGRLLACFEDATVRYFRLLDDNTWDLVEQ